MSFTNYCPRTVLYLALLPVFLADLVQAKDRENACTVKSQSELPNFVIVFTDDQGYRDVGCFGSDVKTPNLDKMAAEGIRFTDFYVAQPVCSASRAALMTGCFPNRIGIAGALMPDSNNGINQDELTIAEVAKKRDYATAIYGKWHLGRHLMFLPQEHGFDAYFGLPYSNDMWPFRSAAEKKFPPLPLIEGDKVVKTIAPKDQSHLTTWYTQHAVRFIEENRDRPFLLYVAHNMPHVPLFVSDKYKNHSSRGLYGDVIEEIDWSVGQILDAIKRYGLDENTLVIFTSDNGPWLSYGNHAGCALPLREGKGTTFEGGVRVPCIMRWPGKIPAGSVCRELAATIDILPTIARLIDVELPKDRIIDGRDIWPLLSAQPGAKTPHEFYPYYYYDCELHAIRNGPWKLHFPHRYRTLDGRPAEKDGKPAKYVMKHTGPGLELYNLENDIGETTNVAAQYPKIVKRLQACAEKVREDLGDSLTHRKGKNVRLPGIRKPVGKQGADAQPPNIIFIMSDDHAAHAIGCYGSRINETPNIDRLAQGGMRFTNCFCTNSLCGPSRAVILTGKYSHLNGFTRNGDTFNAAQQTAPKLLQKAGYQTAMIGKWHLESEPTGFDYWNILPGQGEYYNPILIEMGRKKAHEGYVTEIITDLAIEYLDRRCDKSRPFFLMCHHKAPHRAWLPSAKYLKKYDDVTIPEPPTLFDDYKTRGTAAKTQEMTIARHFRDVEDLKLDPPPDRNSGERKIPQYKKRFTPPQLAQWDAAYGQKNAAFYAANFTGKDLVRWKYQRYIKDYLRCIASVDDGVGRILDYLDETGLADNTIVIYTSDQGFFLGDHGWYDKRFMYEESYRMPLLVRWPANIKPGTLADELVLNLDFAETFLAAAGVPIPADMQGRSLLPILENGSADDWRKAVYYRYYEYPAVHMVNKHYGVRTKRYKLIYFHELDEWELYDLKNDPHETKNIYNNPAQADRVKELKDALAGLKKYYKDNDKVTEYP